MNLHIESYGAGAPLLLIPGWGMHCGIWGGMVERLALHFRVHCVDLSGYNASSIIRQYDLDGLVQWFSEHWRAVYSDEPLALCGWSLGGQVALRWAYIEPNQISRLVLVATTPSFIKRGDWEYAMSENDLDEFSIALMENHVQTLKRFIALQLRGSENERDILKSLLTDMQIRGQPNILALYGGLEILRNTDLRVLLPNVTQKALVIAGESDMLTLPAASNYLARQIPNAQLLNIRGAAHIPFLSHPDRTIQQIEEFLNG